MWTRKDLKEKGKRAFNRNYWKTVLVSLIALIVFGGTVGGSRSAWSPVSGFTGSGISSTLTIGSHMNDFDKHDLDDDDPITWSDESSGDTEFFDIDDDNFESFIENGPETIFSSAVGIAMIIVFAIIFLIVMAIIIVIDAFLGNPLQIGTARFFVRNLNTEAEIRELAYGYDHGYLNVVKTMFFKSLYTFLWSLLLIIPGIVKSYEYRMIPFILSEHPEMPMKDVFAKSREMMTGNKWKAFVLDLSFIGWSILSLLTLGLLGVFYVNPYRSMTNAALYEALEYGPDDSGCGVASPALYDSQTAGTLPAEDTTWNNETTY